MGPANGRQVCGLLGLKVASGRELDLSKCFKVDSENPDFWLFAVDPCCLTHEP
jgi:hypothetical protein